MTELNFDASRIEPDKGVGDPVPAGWYNVAVDSSEVKPTKTPGGQRLAFSVKILDGQFVGRKIFGGFNIKNDNAQAQEISLKQLSALCHATGVIQLTQTEQLHAIPFKARVKVKAASGEYEAQNEITAFRNINEDVGATATTTAAPAGGFGASAPVAPAPVASAPAPAAAPAWGAQSGVAPNFAGAAPSAPAPPPSVPAPAPAPAAPVKQMTDKAEGRTYQAYLDAQWADQQMIEAGVMILVGPTPSTPPPPAASADPAVTAGVATPPWQKPAA